MPDYSQTAIDRTANLPRMSNNRSFELADLVHRPGTYMNPQTEVLIVVDDGAAFDSEVFEQFDEAEWVQISDEPAINEQLRDELIDSFQTKHHESTALDDGDDLGEEPDSLDPDEDEEEPDALDEELDEELEEAEVEEL